MGLGDVAFGREPGIFGQFREQNRGWFMLQLTL